MKKSNQILFNLFIIILAIFILSAIPNLISIRQGKIYIDVKEPIRLLINYYHAFKDGELPFYRIGNTKKSLIEVLPKYFITSFTYLISSLSIGIFLGTISGLLLSNNKTIKIRDTLSLIGHIPDFILIIFFQLLVISINNKINIKLFRVTSAGNDFVILLPLITLSIYPLIYLMKLISTHTYNIRKKSYILYAKSKGLSNRYIFFKHILPGIFPVIFSELHGITGMLIANLFIAERLFNISGLTRFLFYILGQNNKPENYNFFQGHVVVNTLITFVLLYYLLYSIIYIALKLTKRILFND